MSRTLIVLVGPTSVGKTDVAVKLGKLLKTEIVSADARQVYREMEIGTAKPGAAELHEVPHHFINSHSIHEEYNAAMYGEEALAIIEKILTTHDYAILCGGSGLYIKAVLEGFDDIPEIDESVRESIVAEYKEKGLEWLKSQVKEADPDYFQVVDTQNPHRLIRALEVVRGTGRRMADWQGRKPRREHSFRIVKIGLSLPMPELYDRIDRRMDQMIKQGLFDEAAQLYPLRHLQALQTVGYREIFAWMDHSYDRDEAIRLLKRNTRHYAKRQMTWFRKDEEIRWVRPDDWTEIVNLATTV